MKKVTGKHPVSGIEAELQAVVDRMRDAFLILDRYHRFIYLNPNAEQVLHQTREELMGVSIWEVFPADKCPRLSELLTVELALDGKITGEFYSPLHAKWLQVTAYDTPTGISVLMSDMKSERPANGNLTEAEVEHRAILDSLPQIAYTATSAGENTFINNRWTDYTGKPTEESMGIGWRKNVHPHDLQPFLTAWEINVPQGNPFRSEYRLMNKKGEYRWHLAQVAPLASEKGGSGLWVGTATDIQQQKEAEAELRESRLFVTKITEATPDLITVYDLLRERFTYGSSQIYNLLGYSPRELKNFSQEEIRERIFPGDWPSFIAFHQNFRDANDDEIRELEFRARNNRGEWHYLKTRGKVFQRDDQGKVCELIAITHDITTQKEVEEKERQNRLLQELIQKRDEFMSVASHELKTPITTMKASLQIIQRLIDKHEEGKVLLVFVQRATQQVNKLVGLIGQLMDNARIQAGKIGLNLSFFSIGEVLEDCLAHVIDHHEIIVMNNSSRTIHGDKNKIEQVITNFLNNAIKYSPGASEVVVRAVEEDDFLKFSVADYGIGIPEDKVDKVFDRFFRVDEGSAEFTGLGLGLYISSEIIKQHHGEYGVESQVGEGSTFWFKIPFEQPNTRV